MPLKETGRPRPSKRSTMAAVSQENSEEKMHTSFLSCSIEEEDILDNVEPNLLTDSSHLSCGSRSRDEAQEPSDYDNLVRAEVTHHPVDSLCGHRSIPELSSSMHDLSHIPSFPLVSKQGNRSSETMQSQSITTVGCKSKDSGFPRSLSCVSLNSGRSYDHVQSKVREYIRQIKAGNKARRKLTYDAPANGNACKVCEDSTPQRTLVPIVDRLRDELDEKDRMLSKLQENYDALLMKYAAAEYRMDHLRVSLVGNPFEIPPARHARPKASPSVLLLPSLRGLRNESVEKSSPFDSTPAVSRGNDGRCTFRESERVESRPLTLGPESPRDNLKTTPEDDDNGNGTRPLNQQLENPFVKVKRWQESLPSMHLIEPGVYDRFPGSESGSDDSRGKKDDGGGQLSSEGDGFALLDSNLSDEPSIDPCVAGIGSLNETERVNVELASAKSESSGPPPHFNSTSPSNVSPTDDPDAHSVPLKNFSDVLSCHTASHSKDTKDVHSVSTSIHSSSTFHCLEKASNQSVSGHECAHNESSSVATSTLFRDRDVANQKRSSDLTVMSPAQNKPYVSHLAQANDNVRNSLAQNPLPPIVAPLLHKSHLPSLPKIQPIAKRLFSSEPSNSILSFLNLDITKETGQSSSLCRKRLLGQKARLLLMEYLKNSDSTCNCCTKENPNRLACSCSTVANGSQIRKERSDSFEDKNVSLVQCLDEMNQCAEKLRGKSEAIMEVLSKQLRES